MVERTTPSAIPKAFGLEAATHQPTRSLNARKPVQTLSPVLCDFSLVCSARLRHNDFQRNTPDEVATNGFALSRAGQM
jgi:hypothetical protein